MQTAYSLVWNYRFTVPPTLVAARRTFFYQRSKLLQRSQRRDTSSCYTLYIIHFTQHESNRNRPQKYSDDSYHIYVINVCVYIILCFRSDDFFPLIRFLFVSFLLKTIFYYYIFFFICQQNSIANVPNIKSLYMHSLSLYFLLCEHLPDISRNNPFVDCSHAYPIHKILQFGTIQRVIKVV